MGTRPDIAAHTRIIDQHLLSWVQSIAYLPLREATSYSLFPGGKRLRPLIAMLTAQHYDLSQSDILPYACAIEMVHTYSLIHDDLPAMDNDDLRRGRPTLHKQFDDATAILVGDGLLTNAFGMLVSYSVDADVSIRLVTELVESAGVNGMIAGQLMDVASNATADTVEDLYLKKTSGLIRAAFVGAGIIARQPESVLSGLSQLGNDLGLLFQIQDDVLDIEGHESVTGKPVGSDIDNERQTYTVIKGVDVAKDHIRCLRDKIETHIKTLGFSDRSIGHLINDVFLRQY